MPILQTERLTLRHLTPDDAAFMQRLVNEPTWLRYIGDRNVHTLEAARDYLLAGPIENYTRLGFGFYAVELRKGSTLLGICGLAKRDYLDDVDVGYALLPEHCGQGYAQEAAQGVLSYARDTLGIPRVVATVRPDNAPSIKVLEKLGMQLARRFRREEDDRELLLYAVELLRT